MAIDRRSTLILITISTFAVYFFVLEKKERKTEKRTKDEERERERERERETERERGRGAIAHTKHWQYFVGLEPNGT